MNGGTVTVHAADGKTYTGKVNADGTYEVKNVPAGNYVVSVDSPGLPKKWADPKTSGLMFEVKEDQQLFDLDLK